MFALCFVVVCLVSYLIGGISLVGGGLIALLWLFGCVLSVLWQLVSLPPCALGWSVVCACCISRSLSLAFSVNLRIARQ